MINILQNFLCWFLIASQVLVGSGDSLYLCLHADGSFCGIGLTPEDCPGCDSQSDGLAADVCCNSCSEVVTTHGLTCQDGEDLGLAFCPANDCNCTQFQVSTGEWINSIRSHSDDNISSGHPSVFSSVGFVSEFVLFPSIDDELNPTEETRSQNPKLTELSSIMLRC